jgi:L-ascorbate metabolism protein UlaG (beta-lactamase superfamily)
MDCQLTYVGSATVLLDIGPFRLLTDPAFDPAGTTYEQPIMRTQLTFTRLTNPALLPPAIGRVDAVLLSHDEHFDNLDYAGRAFLPEVKQVVTTAAGARRLGGNALGLDPWQSATLIGENRERLQITAVPARHGPFALKRFVGEVTGFVLEWEGQQHGVFYISGDTVWFHGLAEIGRRFPVSMAMLHMGMGGFPTTGSMRFSFNGADAVRMARACQARTILPVHYEGWSHFQESPTLARQAFAQAGLADQVVWLPPGGTVPLHV